MSNFNKEEADIDFELPVISSTNKPRIHKSEEKVCIACE